VLFLVAVLFLREERQLRLRDSDGGQKKETSGAWSSEGITRPCGYQFEAEKEKQTGKGSTFLMMADNFFRILRSCPLRANIFLSQHFPEILLLENIRFTLF
jgi:hypothetical protein